MLVVGAEGYLWYINYGFIANASVFSTHQCSFPKACSFFMCFSITFCSFRAFFKPFSQQFIPIAGSECFSKVALTFLAHITEQAIVCCFWWKGQWNSIIHTLFQSTFQRLGNSDFLLKKCCIRLLKFCGDFWSNFSFLNIKLLFSKTER